MTNPVMSMVRCLDMLKFVVRSVGVNLAVDLIYNLLLLRTIYLGFAAYYLDMKVDLAYLPYDTT